MNMMDLLSNLFGYMERYWELLLLILTVIAGFNKLRYNLFFETSELSIKLKITNNLKKCGIKNRSYLKEVKRQSYLHLTGVDTTNKLNKKICSIVEGNNSIKYFHFQKSSKYITTEGSNLLLRNGTWVKIRNLTKIIIGIISILFAFVYSIISTWNFDELQIVNYFVVIFLLLLGYIFIIWAFPYLTLSHIVKNQNSDFIRLSKELT